MICYIYPLGVYINGGLLGLFDGARSNKNASPTMCLSVKHTTIIVNVLFLTLIQPQGVSMSISQIFCPQFSSYDCRSPAKMDEGNGLVLFCYCHIVFTMFVSILHINFV